MRRWDLVCIGAHLFELVGTIVTSASAMFKMERLDAHIHAVNGLVASLATATKGCMPSVLDATPMSVTMDENCQSAVKVAVASRWRLGFCTVPSSAQPGQQVQRASPGQ
jgi:hypothetical protein